MKVIYKGFKNEVLEYVKGDRNREKFVDNLENELIKNGVIDKEKREISEFIMDILDYLKDRLKDK